MVSNEGVDRLNVFVANWREIDTYEIDNNGHCEYDTDLGEHNNELLEAVNAICLKILRACHTHVPD